MTLDVKDSYEYCKRLLSDEFVYRHYKLAILKYVVRPTKVLNRNLKNNLICKWTNCQKIGPDQLVCLFCLLAYCPTHAKCHLEAFSGHIIFMESVFGFLNVLPQRRLLFGEQFLDIVEDTVRKFPSLNICFREFYFTFKWKWINPRLDLRLPISFNSTGLRPLPNMGSTCFMNCIIQIFANTPPLVVFFLGELHKCHNNHPFNMCHICVFRELFNEFYRSQDYAKPFVPHKLLFLSLYYYPIYRSDKEEDALEFFTNTIRYLCVHRGSPTYDPSTTISGSNKIQQRCCIPNNIYMGVLLSKVICGGCKSSTEIQEPFNYISLNLEKNNAKPVKMTQILKKFLEKEEITYVCSKCKYDKITKQYSFLHLPAVMVIHFMRFNSILKKNCQKVQFSQSLNMGQWKRNRTNSMNAYFQNYNYRLFGIVSHKNKSQLINNGHYVSYVKNHDDWYEADGEYIGRVSIDTVLNAEAYILFYFCNTVKIT